MSEGVCHDIGLLYDPSIKLNMQSANGNVNQSLGLAWNVPCRIGTITLYLQIHVIRLPAYNILLGRPFNVLTESTINNFANEDQTMTIVDPNSKRSVAILTMSWGPPRHQHNCPFYKAMRNWMIEMMITHWSFLLTHLIPCLVSKPILLFIL
jgi:hypothetical protein